MRGKNTLRRMAEFGESVLRRPDTWEGGRMEKLEPHFGHGIWLGVCPRTDEAIIGTSTGIVRPGTVKRQRIEDAWKSTSLLFISTTPWTHVRQSKRHELSVEDGDVEFRAKTAKDHPKTIQKPTQEPIQ